MSRQACISIEKTEENELLSLQRFGSSRGKREREREACLFGLGESSELLDIIDGDLLEHSSLVTETQLWHKLWCFINQLFLATLLATLYIGRLFSNSLLYA